MGATGATKLLESITGREGPPDPTVSQLVDRLKESRRQGMPFDQAWAESVAVIPDKHRWVKKDHPDDYETQLDFLYRVTRKFY